MQLISLFAIVVVVQCCASLPLPGSVRKRKEVKQVEAVETQKAQYCGKYLADAVELACRGINPISKLGGRKVSHEAKQGTSKGPEKSIVELCCHNACALRTLREFCTLNPPPFEEEVSPTPEAEEVTSEPATTFVTASTVATSESYEIAEEEVEEAYVYTVNLDIGVHLGDYVAY